MNKKNKFLSEGEIANHDQRIRGVLTRAYDEHGVIAVTDQTPADLVMAKEVEFDESNDAPDDEYGWPGSVKPRVMLSALKQEEAAEVAYIARRDLVWWLVGDGLHPFKILQRFYALLYASFPDLIGSMDGSWLATILGQGRAAFSALMGRLFGSVAEERLGMAVKVGGQKSAESSQKYASNARRYRPKRQLKGDAGCSSEQRNARNKKNVRQQQQKLEDAKLMAKERDLLRDADEFKKIIQSK